MLPNSNQNSNGTKKIQKFPPKFDDFFSKKKYRDKIFLYYYYLNFGKISHRRKHC